MEYYNIQKDTPYNNFANNKNINKNRDFKEKKKKIEFNHHENNANIFNHNQNKKFIKQKIIDQNSDNILFNNRSEYDRDFGDINNNIKNLQSKLEEKEKIMRQLEEEYKLKISSLNRELFNREKKIEEVSNTIEEKDRKINILNINIFSLTKEIDNLKLSISSNDEILEILKKNNLLKIREIGNSKSAIEEFMPKYDGKDPLKFYDIIVDINSIKEFVNGWNIMKNDKGLNYLNNVDETSIKIGVVGNGNKGKSFILSKISDIELPVGESIKTKGLSIKFPQLENHTNRNITLLDSAGQETPVLNNNKNFYMNSTFDNKNNNEIEKLEKLAEKSRDKLLTEFFLQNYIVRYSDLLIIVVGILTFSEQKLINKIQKTYSNFNKKGKLIVIHNLQSYVTIEQVKTYISETLLKSDTFNLKQQYKVSKERTSGQTNNNDQWCYYHEPKSNPNTVHLIFAREKSPAGNFYNQMSIEHIYDIINTINEKEPLNLIQNIKELFMNISSQILETQINDKDIEFKNDKIKLNITKNGELKLKKCSINELGFNKFSSNGFEPKYCCYIHKDMLIIICEISGEISKGSFKVHADCENGKCIIKIEGNKLNEISSIEKDCKIINMQREFGPYNLLITIEDFNIDTKSGKLEKKDGLIKISYPIKNSSSDLTFD